jgi:hypothetical protein
MEFPRLMQVTTKNSSIQSGKTDNLIEDKTKVWAIGVIRSFLIDFFGNDIFRKEYSAFKQKSYI